MTNSEQSAPSSSPQNSSGELSPVDIYFHQLSSIDLEVFKELPPVCSDLDQTIVQAIMTDVCKFKRAGFQCIKSTKKTPRASLPLQSDWLKMIGESGNSSEGLEQVVGKVLDDPQATIRPPKRKN
ncbi:hypothetical protein PTTG_25780 [Puccinia triticina 1-1 BBBD Race 1]|uniref:Uncharacterized protein n=2 Tax=Puccinia triticina TaxID=208348 RepID=A0A180H0A7_PUCT1|nr:uncharacterized protein PtA15_10A459 [Puccinia triticina]OAV98049.1 hypothetical protein PTTG_25780 [Puccinia triticina 1-1 BBBD Race 1]WAQ89036.1 hypothetical protein PtA15_10A459 [Puccinia triticina]WAR59096.1 hypothetical protein PtB15_10B438 [Puccinia triticina]